MTGVPNEKTYDVVVIGGAMIGSSIAFWLTRDPTFQGRVLVIEQDPTYSSASTSHTNSCIRQQFGSEVNVQISRFGAEFMHNFQAIMQDDHAPKIHIHSFGYLYLADSAQFAAVLRENVALQNRLGAATRVLTPDEIAEKWPFYDLDGIFCGTHNAIDEGYFDGGTIFDWCKRKARARGAEYVHNAVVSISRTGDKVTSVTLASGETISAGTIVNASGPRANVTAQMAGLSIPVEPRRRFTWIFQAEQPLPTDLPLTIDPSGVHMRTDGQYYMCGCPPDEDSAVEFDDFQMDYGLWENKVWPVLASRVPAFGKAKVVNEWAGHYAYNTFDQNAVIGPHTQVSNFYFCNGFSGHGLQQSPAMGRGMAELIVHGEFKTLDLTSLSYDRIAENRPLLERAII
ncbi:MAG: glycine/D-amino acid oxidase-like deaminating enzyme [Gammaproteobacteria bacterium]|jgi:glycine/D-amino acid oxidase-like deaminating enzyme